MTIAQITKFAGFVVLFASPILYLYMDFVSSGESFKSNDFSTRFIYGLYNSILLNLIYKPKAFIMLMVTVGMFIMGYIKWRDAGGKNEYILPITLGVLIVYVLDFVLVDVMFNGIAMRLMLLRSVLNVKLFTLLFFAFLIARQGIAARPKSACRAGSIPIMTGIPISMSLRRCARPRRTSISMPFRRSRCGRARRRWVYR